MNQHHLIHSKSALIGSWNISASPLLDDSQTIDDQFSFKEIFASVKEKISSDKEEKETTGGGNGGSIISGIIGGLGSIAGALPQLGIGSRSRIKEAQAMASINKSVYDAQNEAKAKEQKTIIIGGVIVLLLVVVIFALKK